MSESRRAMPEAGDRVVLAVEVDRFPDVLVPAGMHGTVEYADEGKIRLSGFRCGISLTGATGAIKA